MSAPSRRPGGFQALALAALVCAGCTDLNSYNPFALRTENDNLRRAVTQLQTTNSDLQQQANNLDENNQKLQQILAQERSGSSAPARMAGAVTAVPAVEPPGPPPAPTPPPADFADRPTDPGRNLLSVGPPPGERVRIPTPEQPPAAPVPPAAEPPPTRGPVGTGLPLATIPGAEVRRVGDTVHIRITGARMFDPGKAMLKPEANPVLDQVGQAIQDHYAGLEVGIEGHTDADPIRHSHWHDPTELSYRRAKAVFDYLKDRAHVPAAQMVVVGFGATRPVSSGTDPLSKARNRRVEVVIYPHPPREKT